MQEEREAAALLTLLRTRSRDVTWGRIAAAVSMEGSATAVLAQGDSDALFALPAASELAEAEADIRRWNGEGHQFVTVLDDDYPARLRDIRETPPFLFFRGDLRPNDLGMSVVGSRSASKWGLDFAAEAARLLISEGLSVLGGLALGVDTAAHQAALDAGGRTVAFLGNGISTTYPAPNAGLQNQIGTEGLVLSQSYPDAPPTKQTFPMRNATMSGYGLATIVVEAGEYSGTRSQARLAGQHGRPVILTTQVASSTSWGEALKGMPNVHIVADIDQLRDTVREIRETPNRLRSALDALAES